MTPLRQPMTLKPSHTVTRMAESQSRLHISQDGNAVKPLKVLVFADVKKKLTTGGDRNIEYLSLNWNQKYVRSRLKNGENSLVLLECTP